MARKGLNDVIQGDRAVVRANHYSTGGGRVLDDWDKWDAAKKGKGSKIEWPEGGVYGSSKDPYKACYHTHPALKLPGTDLVCYGGSCSTPVVKDADIYIGFDLSMTFTGRSWPWKQGHEFLFKITDMSVPSKPEEFVKLVSWAKEQIDAGKKLHAGCIGGHGRTGTFLAALVSLYGEMDAIAYVRKHYCHKAVESAEQVKFLGKHFGIKEAQGAKSTSVSSGSKGGSKGYLTTVKGGRSEEFTPVGGNGCIFG